MTELEKYELVNSADSTEELEKAIELIAEGGSTIQGRTREFSVKQQQASVQVVVDGKASANLLTRSYGIRQQALYLSHYGR